MDTNEEIVVEVAPDPVVVIEPEPKPEPEAKTETVQIEPVEELRKQLDELKAADEIKGRRLQAEASARLEAEQKASRATEEVTRVRTEIVDREVSAIESGIEAARAQSNEAKRDLKSAYEAGDFDKVAEAQERISTAAARLVRLDEAKADLAAKRLEPPKPEPRMEARADPLETVLSKVTPRTATWLRQHPEFVTDQTKNLKANAAHTMAVSEGLRPDSDEYFDYCEKFLGLKKDDTMAEPEPKLEPKPEPKPRTRPMPGAPVSRDAVSGNGGLAPSQIVLTPGEQRAATDGSIVWNYNDPKIGAVKNEPIGVKEYAKRKMALQKQGAYDRSWTE